jgi:hypothetical protein
VLGVERLEHELRRLEPPRDVEVARDELLHATDRRTLAQGAPGRRIITWCERPVARTLPW